MKIMCKLDSYLLYRLNPSLTIHTRIQGAFTIKKNIDIIFDIKTIKKIIKMHHIKNEF